MRKTRLAQMGLGRDLARYDRELTAASRQTEILDELRDHAAVLTAAIEDSRLTWPGTLGRVAAACRDILDTVHRVREED